ncbi:ectonucleotide pyrophosphatase/phosphodiesterase family member 7-like [Oryx dammah]|uniref:ectonucleotide pyrophosphatase/phosphodiesterase family member 7-like n=1 Tax=Oryx dammah TaxID=59534 RepID=UPI001A9B4967|nr:ectonucleotide pyrophosphatase/phosphodiesterase family member 7-like [Oryx dammah]
MDMKTIFRAFGPDFKKNHLAEPFDSIHIYPLMCKLLGVTPEPHNGSLAVTQDMLVDTYNQQTGAEMKRASALQNAAIGLTVVTGVLVVLFVAGVTFTVFYRKKMQRADQNSTSEPVRMTRL